MFKKILAKLAAMSLASKVIAVAAAAVIVVGAIAIGVTSQGPSNDPQDQQNAPQQEQQAGDIDRDDEDEASDVIADADGVVADDDKKDSNKKKDESKEEQTGIFVKKYTVKFETGEGSNLKKVRVLPGTAISSLDTPYCAEHIFLGWYYDETLTEAVESDDTVTENLTLYASYLEQQPLETLETVNFASAVDVGTGFTISVVSADAEMSAADVLAAMTAEDLSDPDAKDVITVSGSNGNYTVKGKEGFREGGSYRITLNSDALTFKDQPASAREFNFTVHRDEVMNLTMQSDITYIPAEDVSDIRQNGTAVASLDISFYESNGSTVSPAELTTGSFTYGGDLAVDNKVCVYEGALPTNRDKDTPKDQLGDMAYLTITGKNGNTYTYESTEAEDVLFMPDVLPMPENADTDSDAATITVENKYLDYSADMYSQMNLDSQTTVDVGDFLAFYTGELGVESGKNAGKLTGYGKVTNVAQNGNETTTVSFVTVTWDEVQACMDVYAQETLSGEELLEGVDTENMESEIEQQAYDSGFAEEAATYLTSLALATENFTALSDNMNLEDYKVTLTDGTPVSPETLQLMAGGGIGVEIDGISVKARVNTKPTHLGNIAGTSADEKGLSIGLEVTVVFTIASEAGDGELEITVTGSFIEEVGVDFGVNADAVWDWAFIFPYISDIIVSANVDTMNYTGISFNATMITKEKNDSGNAVTDALDMAEEIKELLSYMTSDGDEAKSTQDIMAQRYAEMLNAESDWIRVVEYNIVEVKKSVPFGIPLININFSVAFVIDMDASISVGFDFQYVEGKRHVFTIEVKDRKVYSNTIDLQEKTYQFCFYAMGRISLEAGIEMDFSISVISEKLGSVGFEAGAGAYMNMRGYFFYELKYTASQGKTQQYNGALLIDMGIYMEAGLKAQALGGKYAATVKFIDKKWPLYSAGERENVLDFSTTQEDMPAIAMKQYVRNATIPDSIFYMDTLDLYTGEIESLYYSDQTDGTYPASRIDGYEFVITMTNDKFTYNPRTNTIAVNPAEDDVKLEGEMVITYKQNAMSFSSKAIQRTISLYWDNLRDGYMIVPESNGGSYIPMITGAYEAKIKAPANPERFGYIFDGWYSDEALTNAYTFPELMPATDTSIYAKWTARTDIPYTVEHYLEDLYSGTYQLVEIENFTNGTTDSYITPAVKNYEGYISPTEASIKIEADGSATLCYYYRLKTQNVTFYPGEVGGEPVTFTLKYGSGVPVPQMAAGGYVFVGWTVDGTNVVTPASKVELADLSYKALWEKEPDTAYRVEYYVQQADGRFTLQHMYEGKTFTGTTFSASELRTKFVDDTLTADQKYIDADAVYFRDVTVEGIPCDNATVDGSGKTVIKVNYARAQYALTFDLGYDDKKVELKDFVGAEVILPENPARTGYAFRGWSTDDTTVVVPSTIIGKENITYTALWKANEYTVKFNAGSGTGEMADMSFVYDKAQNLTANAFTRTHYDFAGWVNGGVSYTDGESVTNLAAQNGVVITLTAKWTPKNYTVTYYNVTADEHTNLTGFTVESDDITLSEPAVRVGYTFGGWYTNEACTGTAVTKLVAVDGGSKTLYAKWVPNSDTAYTAEHYCEELNGTYTLTDTDNLNGTTATEVTPAVKSYVGFAAPAAQTVVIKADGSLVVQYHYTRQSYTVAVDANGGIFADESTTKTLSFRYGETIVLPVLNERPGYGFSGWYYANGALFSAGTMGDEDLALTAQWAAGQIGYTVNHYQQNVSGVGYTLVKTINGTADMDSIVIPALENYDGFTAPNSTTTLAITATAANNVVDYYYTRNQYDLSWNLNGGSTDGQIYTSGQVYFDAPITAPVPVKEGYRLSWDKSIAAKMPAEAVTYTANWVANTYTVKFNVNGGSGAMPDMSFVYGTAQNLPTNAFTRTGYTFAGWATSADGAVVYADGANVTDLTAENNGAVTLYAVWTANTYTVKFDGNGGSGAVADLSLTYNGAETALHANSFTRSGYTFIGWATAKSGAVVYGDKAKVRNLTAENNGTVILYAVWDLNTYSISYGNVNEGTHANPKTYTVKSDTIALSEPNKREGYDFMGWYDNEACTGIAVTAIAKGSTGDKTLYAKWEETKCTITYELGGGTNHGDNPESFTINANTFTLNAPTRAGYLFLGWYSDKDMTVQVVNPVTLTDYRPWTFYAKWTPIAYKVVLYANDGTENAETNPYVTCESEWTAKAPTRKGYTFEGWAYSENDDVVCNNNATLIDFVLDSHENGDEIELFAKWTLNTCTVTYDLGSGADAHPTTNPLSFTVHNVTLLDGTTNSASVQLADPAVKEGYEFLGWYNGEKRVTDIAPTAVESENEILVLKAKWAHGGIFSITCTEETLAGGPTVDADFNATFTVTRTLPVDAVLSDAVQTVYVRTQNGTAYGTTPEMANEEGQDQFHFIHTSQTKEGSGYLTFDSNSDDTQTITVTEKDLYNADYVPASFQSGSTARHYFVQIYNVIGGGVIDSDDGIVQRNLPLTPYEITKSLFTDWTGIQAYFEDGTTKKSWSWSTKDTQLFSTSDIWGEEMDEYVTAGKYSIQCRLNGKPSKEIEVVIRSGSGRKQYERNLYPSGYPMQDFKVYCGSEYYAEIYTSSEISVELYNWEVQLETTNSGGHKAEYIAPLAATSYKAGDEVMLTMVRNRVYSTVTDTPILDVSGTLLKSSYDSKLSEYFESAEYVTDGTETNVSGGTGTNAVVFKAIVKKDLTADDVLDINGIFMAPQNKENTSFIKEICPNSVSVKDLGGD